MRITENSSLIARLRGVGVSAPYASQIASGKRKPSLELALRIWRATGLQLGQLEGKSESDIASLSNVLAETQQ